MANGNLARWIRRNSKPLPSGDIRWWILRHMKLATGKVCADISMSIPGATFAMSLPGMTMALSIPGADMTLALPGAAMALTAPNADISLEDCS